MCRRAQGKSGTVSESSPSHYSALPELRPPSGRPSGGCSTRRHEPPDPLSCCESARPPEGSDSPGVGGQECTDLTPRSSSQPRELELCPVPCTWPVRGDSPRGISCLEAGSSGSTWEGRRPEVPGLSCRKDTEAPASSQHLCKHAHTSP